MNRLVLVTHGNSRTASAPRWSTSWAAIAVRDDRHRAEDDMEQRRGDILEAASGPGRLGVVLLTDMFGGTPSNLAISAMEGGRIESSAAQPADADKARHLTRHRRA